MMKRVACLMLVLGVLAVFAGCNTTRGAGQDLERAGEKVQDVAR